MEDLAKKVTQSINLLQSFEKVARDNGSEVELAFSGGKDSCIIKRLADLAGIKYRAIYKNTTIDPVGTVAFCKQQGCEVLRPKETFFHIVQRKGLPTRHARFCCEILKEYKVLDYVVTGVRKSESAARNARYNEPEICRVYSKEKKVRMLMPILYWDLNDVKDFITTERIPQHPLYYREDGTIDVKKRLGCVGCPLKSDCGKADFRANPKFLRQLIRSAKIWWDTHPNARSHEKFLSVYDLFYHDVFCKSYEEYARIQRGFFDPVNMKAFLEDYFKIELP